MYVDRLIGYICKPGGRWIYVPRTFNVPAVSVCESSRTDGATYDATSLWYP